MVTGTPWRHGLSLADAAPDFCCARTEAPGRADLRACALVQLLPMLLIPLMMLLCRERSDLGRYRGWMIAFTITAKRLEFFDNAIFAAGGIVSGHSVKHLFAAMAPASLLYGLRQRRYHAARRPTL